MKEISFTESKWNLESLNGSIKLGTVWNERVKFLKKSWRVLNKSGRILRIYFQLPISRSPNESGKAFNIVLNSLKEPGSIQNSSKEFGIHLDGCWSLKMSLKEVWNSHRRVERVWTESWRVSIKPTIVSNELGDLRKARKHLNDLFATEEALVSAHAERDLPTGNAFKVGVIISWDSFFRFQITIQEIGLN